MLPGPAAVVGQPNADDRTHVRSSPTRRSPDNRDAVAMQMSRGRQPHRSGLDNEHSVNAAAAEVNETGQRVSECLLAPVYRTSDAVSAA